MASTVRQALSLTIRRHYPKPPEKVWQALTTSAGLQRWMAPSDDFRIPTAECDARVGGRYRLVMVAPDGKEHDVRGVYREVDPPRKLVYTWQWHGAPEQESVVTVELRAKDGGTELVLTHQGFADEGERGHHEQGWNGCLDRLAKALPT